MLKAGELDKKVLLKRPTTARDSFGEVRETTLVDVAKVSAKVKAVAQPESSSNGTTTPRTKFEIEIRFRKDIQPDWRIDYGGQLLDIESIADPEQKRVRLVIIAYAPKT